MNRDLCWGIVSSGKISADFACALKSLSGHKVVCVAARDSTNAKSFADRFEIECACSYEELAKNKDVEITYIGSILPQHYSLAKLMLENGKHVLCEKPFTLASWQAEELVALAKKKKLFLQLAIWTRFFPAVKRAMDEIRKGALGDIRVLSATMALPLLHMPRIRQKDMGGGSLLDFGVYCVQWALFVFGEKPTKIVANGSLLADEGVDEGTSIYLGFSGNRFAHILTHAACRLPSGVNIGGTKGTIQFPDFCWCPTTVIINGKSETFPVPENKEGLKVNYDSSEGLQYEASAVRDCILQGQTENPLMPLVESVWITETLDECRRQLGIRYDCDK